MKDAYLAARKAGMSKEDAYAYAKDVYQKNHIPDAPDGYILMSNKNVRRLLEGRGLDSQSIDNTINSFDGPIYARQGRAG